MFDDLIGIPFKYGEIDCWNLVKEVYSRYNKPIPDYNIARKAVSDNYDLEKVSHIIADKANNDWIELEKPKTPCVIAMSLGIPGFMNHVGVYIGEGKFIHTSQLRGSVTIERLDNPLFRNRKFYDFINSN